MSVLPVHHRRADLRRRAGRGRALALLLVGTLLLSGCVGADETDAAGAAEDTAEGTAEESSYDPAHGHAAGLAKARKLRKGESRRTIAMPESYTPSAPYGTGTDDYRCFLLDPQLEDDAWLTGTHVLPGNESVVHHVILFQVEPEQVRVAQAHDKISEGPGWTCFGGTGLEKVQNVDDAAWIGAWAPGGKESVLAPGLGVRLAKGTQVVMQVHYNLLAGEQPDISATQLRLAPIERGLEELHTMLLPAPVELPCRPKRADGPLCDRDAAMADVKERFGDEGGRTADLLPLLCGDPVPGERQSCTRTLNAPMTIHRAAGHMHLLGREISIEVNPGTPQARTVLDIPVWDFDDQGSRPVEPLRLEAGETVKVSCRHVQWLRDKVSAFETQREDRYVVWGEGSTDEMCLGMLQVTRP